MSPSALALVGYVAWILLLAIAILSPHGYFGQSNVLGKPDTGGQIVYILDQVRALEREMRESIRDQGLVFSPLLRDQSVFSDPDRTEITLLIYAAPESDVVILHLVFPDVRVSES